MRLLPLIVVLILSAAALDGGVARADLARDSEQHGDVDVAVSVDSSAQSGHADATVRIHARPAVIARLIRSCSEALKLVPGLAACDVLDQAPDDSWQIVRHVENYSWLIPRLTYEFRATWSGEDHVSIERIAGDLRVLKGFWQLDRQGNDTIAHYDVDLAPGVWVPHWMVKWALRHDLPKMLRAVRARAEQLDTANPLAGSDAPSQPAR